MLSDEMNRHNGAPGRDLTALYEGARPSFQYTTNNDLGGAAMGGGKLATLHFVRCLPSDHPHAVQVRDADVL